MSEFFDKNWLALLSLVVAVVGAIPGIIALINITRDRPRFHAAISNWIVGFRRNDDGSQSSFLFLAITIANAGNRPLLPKVFELNVGLPTRFVVFDRELIPEGIQFPSEFQSIEVREPWKADLQRFNGAITMGNVLQGFLIFGAPPDVPFEEMQTPTLVLHLSCVDVFDKRHTCVVRTMGSQDSPTIYPKHGVVIQNREPPTQPPAI